MTESEMREAIAKNVCTVVFEKTNGEERTMHCTANTEFMPEEKKPKGTGAKKAEGVIAAFDVAIQEWRSFRVDSVKEFKA